MVVEYTHDSNTDMFQVCEINVCVLIFGNFKQGILSASFFPLTPHKVCLCQFCIQDSEQFNSVHSQGYPVNKAVCLYISFGLGKSESWGFCDWCARLWFCLLVCKLHGLSPSPSLQNEEWRAPFSLSTWNFASGIYKRIWDQPVGDRVEEIQCGNTEKLLAQLI